MKILTIVENSAKSMNEKKPKIVKETSRKRDN